MTNEQFFQAIDLSNTEIKSLASDLRELQDKNRQLETDVWALQDQLRSIETKVSNLERGY